jgi:ribonuclease HI
MYAVAKGRVNGIFTTWKECQQSIKGFSGAKYKKFETREDAEHFIQSYGSSLISEYKPDYYVYTDGACSHNGARNARAGIGIFFGVDDPRNVSLPIEGKTNNIAELTAIRETYFKIEPDLLNGKKITIVTDSEYAIKCVTSYGESCEKKDWVLDIPNQVLVKETYLLYKPFSNIQFLHVKAHTKKKDIHSVGNFYADHFATSAIDT